MDILTQHAVKPTDKLSVNKVEALLNSMLKEIQKEKNRATALEEQVRKLSHSEQQQQGQPLAAALSQLKQLQQQQRGIELSTANRLKAVEAAQASAASGSSQLDAFRRTSATDRPTLCSAC